MTKTCFSCEDQETHYSVFLEAYDFLSEAPFIGQDGEQVRSCEACFRNLSGAVLEREDGSGERCRLLFEHDDYAEDPKQIASFARRPCRVCGERLEGSADERFAAARRLLRMFAAGEVSEVHLTCGKCSKLGICPCCNDDSEDS